MASTADHLCACYDCNAEVRDTGFVNPILETCEGVMWLLFGRSAMAFTGNFIHMLYSITFHTLIIFRIITCPIVLSVYGRVVRAN